LETLRLKSSWQWESAPQTISFQFVVIRYLIARE